MTGPSSPFRPLLVSFLVALGVTSAAQSQVRSQPYSVAVAAPDAISAAVAEASRRFGVPETWIRSVMRVESAGNAAAVSRAGAMGLMQVMPATYAELRVRYGLGANPFDVRDNVLAGTAYLREMFDRYGATGMLAAYNAGPGRWEEHLAGRRSLPGETVGYLARLIPMLDPGAAVAPPIERFAARPSPFAAPIFVALNDSQSAGSTPTAANSLRQIIAANTTIVPSSGELFVRHSSVQNASAPPEAMTTLDDRSPAQMRRDITDGDPVVMRAHSLFPSRATAGEQR